MGPSTSGCEKPLFKGCRTDISLSRVASFGDWLAPFERKWSIRAYGEIATVSFTDEDFRRGVTALQAGNLKEAERRLQAVIRTQPKHVPALNLLGIVLARLGRDAHALGIYDQALALSPNSAE